MKLDYTIMVPSRKRTHNMATIRSLLPSAVVCIDEREADDYAPFVPKDRLLLHPPLDGLPAVYNWMIDNCDSEIFIEIDDDFKGVRCLTGANRYITDSEEILAILENAMVSCKDLDLTCFTFSKTANRVFSKAEFRPIIPVHRVSNCFGVMGAARHRKYDVELLSREDVDWTCETLLKDRIVYCDQRFFFDVGTIYSGIGGSVGLIDSERFGRVSLALKKKWGKHVSFGTGARFRGNSKTVPTCQINVRRTANTVTT